jgi:hypothetical protein
MTNYEGVANKIIAIFSDLRVSLDDLGHIAFYVVQNTRGNEQIITRMMIFDNHVIDHYNRQAAYDEYYQDSLF